MLTEDSANYESSLVDPYSSDMMNLKNSEIVGESSPRGVNRPNSLELLGRPGIPA
jgi:hypothetical protein